MTGIENRYPVELPGADVFEHFSLAGLMPERHAKPLRDGARGFGLVLLQLLHGVAHAGLNSQLLRIGYGDAVVHDPRNLGESPKPGRLEPHSFWCDWVIQEL